MERGEHSRQREEHDEALWKEEALKPVVGAQEEGEC